MRRPGVIVAVVSLALIYDAATVMAANTAIPCLAQAKAVIATSGNVLMLNANVRVDSYSSSNGPYGGNNIKSNGNIIAGGSITNNGAVVKGTEAVNTRTNLPTPAVPPGAINLPLGSSGPGTINISTPGTSLTLAPGTYVVGSMNVNSPGSVTVSPAGPVTIYVTQALNLGGSENVNGIPQNLTFVVTSSTTINVNNGGALYGNIYAPLAPINLNSTAYGYVVGSNVTLNSGASVHRDESESCVDGGVKPTLNCVMQFDAMTYGAIFGYANTTGSNVVLGTGPNNYFASGSVDRGQPILFVPGNVSMATFQGFPVNGSLTYTIAQTSVTASATSPACSSDVVAAMKKLYKGSSDSQAVGHQIAALVSSSTFATMLAAARAQVPAPTPFQASMLDAMSLIASNPDLLVSDTALTTSQVQRLLALRTSLLSNPAVVQLRLLGDAQRATPGQVTCDVIDTVNAGQPTFKSPPPQAGSMSAQVGNLLQSSSLSALQNAVAGVAAGAQSSTLLTINGLLLAASRPVEDIDGLQLPGTAVPTCWTCWTLGVATALVGAYGGAIVGGAIGIFVTGGSPAGIIVGDIAGALVGGYYGFKFGYAGFQSGGGSGRSCMDWCSDHGCNQPQGVCPGDTVDNALQATFDKGTLGQCAVSCQSDADCGTGKVCAQNCCYDVSNYAMHCPSGSSCSQTSDCRAGNNCVFGCCIGDCGYNGTSCSTFTEPLTCGSTANQTCGSGSECTAGCCQFIIP